MKTVLSEIPISSSGLPVGVKVVIGGARRLQEYAGDGDLVAIVGSRSLARTAAAIEFPGLRLFQLTSAGFDGLPVEEYAERGVFLATAGDTYTTPIAETVVYGMLQMARRYRKNPNHRRARLGRNYRYLQELAGKTAVIVGTGRIGTAVASRLVAFDMRVVGYNPNREPGPPYHQMARTRPELYSVLGSASYLVCALPGDESTRGFVNSEVLGCLGPDAVVVNVGRRETICEDDLYRALGTRLLGGAVLDMFEMLPNPITNRFRRLGNTIVLPGTAAISREVDVRLASLATQSIVAVLEDRAPRHVIGGR